MTRPQSIAALNEHWWYRLIKVIFVSIFSLIGILGVIIIFSINYNTGVNYKTSKIDCENGLKAPLSAVGTDYSYDDIWSANQELSGYDYYKTDLEKKLMGICSHYVTMDDGTSVLTPGGGNNPFNVGTIDYKKVIRIDGQPYSGNGSFIPFYPVNTWKNYDLTIVRESEIPEIVIYSLILLGVLLLLFELTRRVFYYIVLGKFRPKKT